MAFNLAELFSAVVAEVPERTALVCGERRLSYAELDASANRFAHHLIAAGIGPGENVGIYAPNSVEWIEGLLGCLQARAVPVNINYRYTGVELADLLGKAQPVALLVDAEYVQLAAVTAAHCPQLRHVIIIGDADAELSWPDGVTVVDYDQAVAGRPPTAPDLGRSGDDLFLLFTGGTTGMPKGVLWRHEDFYFSALAGGNHYGDPYRTPEALVAAAKQIPEMAYLLAAPLMHGAGSYTLFSAFFMGATVVIARRFDAQQALRLIESERVLAVAAVGDAMVRPLVDELAANPEKYDLSSWAVLGSGGALLSDSVREQLLALNPTLFVTNRFGASESGTDGQFERGEDGTVRLVASSSVCVVDEQMQRVAPGAVGRIAKAGHVPLGYFGDPDATAATFPTIDGVRWAVLGDLGRLQSDGSIVVLGRGSTCINSGGEKVFPEEVEQALKAHPAVMDALVAGVPDQRFGERVCAVVELRDNFGAVTCDELRVHCREHVAGYKVPAHIEFVPVVVRSPTGKADYRWAREVLAHAGGVS